MTKEENPQKQIDDGCRAVLELFLGQNSSICIMAMVSTIEHIATCKDAPVQTIEVVRELIAELDSRLSKYQAPNEQKYIQ